MKIVFLCTSLAAGRDGVGDYVRQLAAACTAQGHVCLLVAVNDRHVLPPASLLQRHNEVRLCATLPWPRRAAMLGSLLHDFDPNWVSWQMVPYGFHPKGILPAGCFDLLKAARPWQSHVMLHELWLGLAQSDPLRPRLVGALQRRQLLAFLRQLSPSCVHTTNPAYQLALARHGWPSELLPLFGNIPVTPVPSSLARTTLTQLAGDALPPGPHWVGALFGTIHPQWNPSSTIDLLRAVAALFNRPIALLAIGRAGAHGTRLLDQLKSKQPDVPVIALGAQSPQKISHLLQAADFGIATHPWALIEKSGTTASFLEHGLPVLVPRDDWQPRHGTLTTPRDPLLRRLDDIVPEAFPQWLGTRRDSAAILPALAARFVAHLSGPIPGALVA